MTANIEKPYTSMTYFKSLFAGIYGTVSGFISPQGWLIKLVMLWLFKLAGIKLYIFSVLTLALIDVISGVLAAKKQGKELQSKVFWRGIIGKFFVYVLLLVAIFHLDLMLQSVFPLEKFYMVFIMSLLVSVYEVTSIIENVVALDSNLAFLRKFGEVWSKLVNKKIEGIESTVEGVKETIEIKNTTEDGKKTIEVKKTTEEVKQEPVEGVGDKSK